MSWVKVQRGGRLFLFDGMFDLSYGPHDVILLDGRFTHGVTVLRDLPGENQGGGRRELERFSLIMFSRWQRGKMRAEKRLRDGHMSEWLNEWHSGVIWSHSGPDQPQPSPMVSGPRSRKATKRYSSE